MKSSRTKPIFVEKGFSPLGRGRRICHHGPVARPRPPPAPGPPGGGESAAIGLISSSSWQPGGTSAARPVQGRGGPGSARLARRKAQRVDSIRFSFELRVIWWNYFRCIADGVEGNEGRSNKEGIRLISFPSKFTVLSDGNGIFDI